MDEIVDTGFDKVEAGEVYAHEEVAAPDVTVAVTESETPAEIPTPEMAEATKAILSLPPLTYVDLATIAREIAMNIKEHHAVLASFQLTDAQYEWLEKHNEFFIAALKAAVLEWHSPLSTQERIKLEAAAILEDSMPGLGARLQNAREQLPGVVEAAKLFAKIAGVGERETGPSTPGERFVINIDLGGDQKTVISTGPTPAQVIAPTITGTQPGNSWAKDSAATIQQEP